MIPKPTSRAVILPHPIDPFMLNYWLYGFNTIWGKYVDHLYIVANSPIENQVVEYVKKITDNPKITLLYIPQQIEHGDAINRALEIVKEKFVMLIEDDCYIFRGEPIDGAFRALENNDYKIVASKRSSCHNEISVKAKEIWGLDYEGEGDHGCNFWPNLFFSSKELLLQTERQFGACSFKRGEIIKELKMYEVKDEVIYGDTFVYASLQLRNLVDTHKIAYLPQHHGHPFDLQHYEDRKYIFDGSANWCHIGSLSSGVHGILSDDNNCPLAYRINRPLVRSNDLTTLAKTEMEKLEYERRLQWWTTFVEFYENNCGIDEMPEFTQLYKNAIIKAIGKMQLSIKRIRKRQEAYRSIGLW